MTMRPFVVLLLATGCISDAALERAQRAFDQAFGPDDRVELDGGSVCAPAEVVLEGTVHPGYAGTTLSGELVIGEAVEAIDVKVGPGGSWAVDVTDRIECTAVTSGCMVEAIVTLTSEEDDASYEGTSTFEITVDNDRLDLFPDGDGDGEGDATAASESVCPGTANYVDNQDDCNDSDRGVNTAVTIDDCDGVDSDCDGDTDEDATFLAYHPDTDGDERGDADVTAVSLCAPPEATSNLVPNADDCDDTRADIYLDAPELCDGDDNNCDGNVDESFSFQPYYADTDGDGAGDPAATVTDCAIPAGYVANFDDCDDTDPDNYTGNDEVCDDQDNDCDGLVDSEDPSNTEGDDYYVDLDGDELLGATTVKQCEAPTGIEGVDWSTSPPTPFVNEDCNDDPITGADFNLLDADADGVASCPRFNGELPDCNDADPNINPTEGEVVDAADVDENCDGAIACYIDEDGDGVGSDTVNDNALPIGGSCDAYGNGLASIDGDCADAPGFDFIYEGATEVFGNGWDEDCSGFAGCYDDTDMDQFGEGQLEEGVLVEDATVEVSCDNPAGNLADDNTDCNDNVPTIFPGATETPADGIDQDCDGDQRDSCFADDDSDGYGSELVKPNVVPAGILGACNDPTSGYADNDDDCDDNPATGALRNPSVPEIPGDGIDQNCDPLLADSCYQDIDDDNYGTNDVLDDVAQVPLVTCETLEQAAPVPNDCDDGNPNINPNPLTVELPANNDDDNCDGIWSCYLDGDGDLVAGGSIGDIIGQDCLAAGAFVAPGADCDDNDPTRFPGNTAGFCDGDDDDCVGGDELVLNTTQDAVYVGADAADQLTAALADANNGDVLELCDAEPFNGPFLIDADLTLRGRDAGGAPSMALVESPAISESVFTVNTGGTVELQYLSVSGDAGSDPAYGGCLHIEAGDVVMDTVDFTECYADRGGAVYVDSGASLDWTTGTCSDSYTSLNGGCLSSEALVTLRGVDMMGNTSDGNGGAFYVTGSGGDLNWNNGTCDSNTASTNGGCFYAGPSSTVDLGNGEGLGVELTATNAVTAGTDRGNQAFIAGSVVAASDAVLFHSTSGPPYPNEVEDFYVDVGDMCWAEATVFSNVIITNFGATANFGDLEVYCDATTCDTSCP